MIIEEADRRVAIDQNATEAAVTLIRGMSWAQQAQKVFEARQRTLAKSHSRRWAVYIEINRIAGVDICFPFAGMNIRDNRSFSEDDEEAAGTASRQTSAAVCSSSREAGGSVATGKLQAEEQTERDGAKRQGQRGYGSVKRQTKRQRQSSPIEISNRGRWRLAFDESLNDSLKRPVCTKASHVVLPRQGRVELVCQHRGNTGCSCGVRLAERTPLWVHTMAHGCLHVP